MHYFQLRQYLNVQIYHTKMLNTKVHFLRIYHAYLLHVEFGIKKRQRAFVQVVHIKCQDCNTELYVPSHLFNYSSCHTHFFEIIP